MTDPFRYPAIVRSSSPPSGSESALAPTLTRPTIAEEDAHGSRCVAQSKQCPEKPERFRRIACALGCRQTTTASSLAFRDCRSTTASRARRVPARAASPHGPQSGASGSEKPRNALRAPTRLGPSRSRSRHQPRSSLRTPAVQPPRGVHPGIAGRKRQAAAAAFCHPSTTLRLALVQSSCDVSPHRWPSTPRKSKPPFSNSCWSTANTRRWSCCVAIR